MGGDGKGHVRNPPGFPDGGGDTDEAEYGEVINEFPPQTPRDSGNRRWRRCLRRRILAGSFRHAFDCPCTAISRPARDDNGVIDASIWNWRDDLGMSMLRARQRAKSHLG